METVLDKITWKNQYYDILFHEVREKTRLEKISDAKLSLHRRSYVSEIPAQFLMWLSPEEIERETVLIARDGIRGLSRFFGSYKPQEIRPRIYVPKELRSLVPPRWVSKVGIYDYYSLRSAAECDGVFIHGTSRDPVEVPRLAGPHLVCDLNLKIDYADSYLTHALLSQGHGLAGRRRSEIRKGKTAEVSAYHGFILTK